MVLQSRYNFGNLYLKKRLRVESFDGATYTENHVYSECECTNAIPAMRAIYIFMASHACT